MTSTDPRPTAVAAELAVLIGHEDARVRRSGLVRLAAHLEAGHHAERARHDTEPAAYASSLPTFLDESAEAALALARIYLRLRRYVRSWPDWRAADLPVPVQIAWLSAEIADRPETVREEPAGDLLYQAVRGIGAVHLDDPELLIRELAGRPDAVLRAEAFRVTREALHAALLSPRRARTLVIGLAVDVPDALRELAEPWAALDPLPHEQVRRLLETGPADAAIEVAARHGHQALLRDVAADDGWPPEPRRRALEALGGLATRDDVTDLLGVAARDPLLLAGPAITCLRGLHRRGHFPSGRDVPAIVGLALADHSAPADEIATLLYPVRHEAVRELTADDPRRLELLVALDAQGTGEPMAGGAVTALARAAQDPAPFLRAIRALRHEAAEETVIELLPRAPRAGLDALEAIGGARTVAALRAGLGLDGGDVAPHLNPILHRALELLWHLSEDPADRRSILDRLNPRDLPPRVAADLGGPDPRELALLRSALDPGEPVEALCRIARNGDASTVPVIADLLLRIVSDLAEAWRSGAGSATPSVEPHVPDDAVTAIRDLGGRLFRRGAIRPRSLLDAADETEAGNALAAGIALDLLERPRLTPQEQSILLSLLLRIPSCRVRARVHPFLRHRDRHVRKHTIALIARDAGDARALSARLIPLTAADDPQTVRQALVALGEAGASWAVPAIAACLDHPTMNVKKTAAAALARAGAPEAVPKLLDWLGRHDNPGLREALTEALRAILGDAFAATLLAAADRATDERTRTLLLRPLEGAPTRPLSDVDALTSGPWDAGIARRVVAANTLSPRLRPFLANWLDLADGDLVVLRFTLRLCSPPWSDAEIETFARASRTLIDALPGHDDDVLVDLLDQVIARFDPVRRLETADRLRRMPLGRAAIVLLRRCDAVLTRSDLERALEHSGPNPWLTQETVLREAFGVPPGVPDDGNSSRTRLDALISDFPRASPDVQPALLDQMIGLQPLGAPPWTVAEEARRPATATRVPRPADLDQPRSQAQRERLLAMLDDPDSARRETAARVLVDWPEPEVRRAVLRAFLDSRIDVVPVSVSASVLSTATAADLAANPERTARLVARSPADVERLLPQLISSWEHGDSAVRDAVASALRRVPADIVAAALSDRLDAGAWGFLDLISGRTLTRSPILTRTVQRLRGEGRDDLAGHLVLVDGPLRVPGAAREDEAALSSLRERRPPAPEPSRADLFQQAREGNPAEVRRALTRLAERHTTDPDLQELLAKLIAHPETRVRLHAHRVSRAVLDRPAYLEQTARLLSDPQPNVVRSAIKTLSHAAWEPAIPGLIALLSHKRPPVRSAAAEGLVAIGEPAVPALKHAAGRARPDRRARYTDVLDAIAAGR
ncbi:HEAT repeat domain-containing protein [Actinomadura rudentiformis]|uniref:HEAT repeat domain-containing protein n=1 Tax=Actinomadura rudentiformis TaxID=359158 RepID=A0A6H9YZV5_9ACTN|nr:HEAT repeat domain-containing protein [Actinomadura rudentiformis]KAB2346989.1 HEAT repeat domain-containing protein [Actinomadura rudentiformis]